MADQVHPAPCDGEEPNALSPFERFESGLRAILAAPKEQVEKLLSAEQEERSGTRRGKGPAPAEK